MAKRTFDWDRALELYKQGKTCREIGEALNVNWHTVNTVIGIMRKEYGAEVVPYWRDIKRRTKKPKAKAATDKPKPKYSSVSEAYRINVAKLNNITTWAGAFKLLAHFAKERGHDDVWEFAQEIAKRKEMCL
jgi:hypothetical protein